MHACMVTSWSLEICRSAELTADATSDNGSLDRVLGESLSTDDDVDAESDLDSKGTKSS